MVPARSVTSRVKRFQPPGCGNVPSGIGSPPPGPPPALPPPEPLPPGPIPVPPDPVPLLVSLKSVDPTLYPFYGQAQLDPAMSLQQALDGDSAVVAEEFLIRLNAHVGETL